MSKYQPAQLEVVGNPIEHSWSPQIHQAFAAQFDRTLSYAKTRVELDGFVRHAESFFSRGGLGMNITVPFKEDAFRFATVLSPAAELAGAVNTLFLKDEVLHGYNTDGIGLVNDLTRRWSCPLSGRRVLVLGAGGSARGLMQPLIEAGVSEIIWVNRTAEKAQQLASKTREAGIASKSFAMPVTQASLNDDENAATVIINTTSVGLQSGMTLGDLCEPRVIEGRICYDLSYGSNALFQKMAAQHGALKSIDGLGMLVEQAAQSYQHWFGEQPDTEPVYLQLRANASQSEQ